MMEYAGCGWNDEMKEGETTQVCGHLNIEEDATIWVGQGSRAVLKVLYHFMPHSLLLWRSALPDLIVNTAETTHVPVESFYCPG